MNSRTAFQTSADPQTIIACPRCATKFSVESTVLENVVHPRFHCSRCDNLFNLEVEAHTATEPDTRHAAEEPTALEPSAEHQEIAGESTLVDSANIWNEPLDHADGSAAHADGSAAHADDCAAAFNPWEEKPLSAAMQEIEPIESYEQTQMEFTEGARSEDQYGAKEEITSSVGATKSLEIPRYLDSGWSFDAPHEAAAPQESGAQFSAFNPDPYKAEQQISAFPEQSYTGSSLATSALQEDFGGRTSQKIPPASSPTSTQIELPHVSRLSKAFAGARRHAASPFRSASTVFMLPLALFAGLLLVVGTMLQSHPDVANAITGTFLPAISRPAPEGLYITSARMRKVTLDSGDTVTVLQGKIENLTGGTLRDIRLGVSIFGKDPSKTFSRNFSIDPDFVQSKLPSLNIETIDELRGTSHKKIRPLRDGESLPYTFVLMPEEVRDGRYFTVRIHSVN